MQDIKLDYYYGEEASQFSFFRIPKQLVKDQKFKDISNEAKMLYGLMLDRMALSVKNGWLDEYNRVYIYYTVSDIMEDLSISKTTAIKLLAELDGKHNINLVERVHQGRGKPDKIYILNFMSTVNVNAYQNNAFLENSDNEYWKNSINLNKGENIHFQEVKKIDQVGIKNRPTNQEVKNLDQKRFKNYTSRSQDFRPVEVKNLYPNNTNINNTEYSYTDMSNTELSSINLSSKMMDGLIRQIKRNIDYDYHMENDSYSDRQLYHELYMLICDVVCVPKSVVKVNGEDYPYELVKDAYLSLTDANLLYVLESYKANVNRVVNFRSYMITALYNSLVSLNFYYDNQVRVDVQK